MFNLPNDAIPAILNYVGQFFSDIKVFIYLALGVGIGLLVLRMIYDTFFSYKVRVHSEATKRLAEMEEEIEEEEFEEDVQEEIANLY